MVSKRHLIICKLETQWPTSHMNCDLSQKFPYKFMVSSAIFKSSSITAWHSLCHDFWCGFSVVLCLCCSLVFSEVLCRGWGGFPDCWSCCLSHICAAFNHFDYLMWYMGSQPVLLPVTTTWPLCWSNYVQVPPPLPPCHPAFTQLWILRRTLSTASAKASADMIRSNFE